MIGDFVKGDVRAEIALQLPRTKLCCVLLGQAPLRQSRIVDRRNARFARTSPFPKKCFFWPERVSLGKIRKRGCSFPIFALAFLRFKKAISYHLSHTDDFIIEFISAMK